jgi:hypothetical protein
VEEEPADANRYSRAALAAGREDVAGNGRITPRGATQATEETQYQGKP